MTQAPSASEVPNSSTELSPENREAWENLVELARRGAGHIPASVLASQVQEVTRGGDWPLQRTALEALLRRWAFARRDGLMVASRPAGQQVLGEYSTRRRRVAGKENKPGSRPY